MLRDPLTLPLLIVGLIPVLLSLYWIAKGVVHDYVHDMNYIGFQVIKKEEDPKRYWRRVFSVIFIGIFIIILAILNYIVLNYIL